MTQRVASGPEERPEPSLPAPRATEMNDRETEHAENDNPGNHRHGFGHPSSLSRAVGGRATAAAITVKTLPPKPCPVGCGNPGFPKLTAPPGLPLTLGPLPLEGLGR